MRGKTFYLAPLFHVEYLYHVVYLVERFRAQLEVVHHVERIFVDTLDYAHKVAERAADSDEFIVGIEFFQPFHAVELVAHVRFYHLRLLERRSVFVEEHGKIHRAYRQTHAVEYHSAVVLDELYRRARNIHDNALGYLQGIDDAVIYLRRLLLLGKYVYLKAADRVDFFQKAALVLRLAHRVGGERVHLVHIVCVAQLAEHFQRLYRLRYARLLEIALSFHILRKPNSLLQLVVNNVITVVYDVCQHQPRRIRTQIDYSDVFQSRQPFGTRTAYIFPFCIVIIISYFIIDVK